MGLSKFAEAGHKFGRFLLSQSDYMQNLDLFGVEALNDSLFSPTLFVANHTKPNDHFYFQAALLAGFSELQGHPAKIVRAVMADDIYLGDGTRHDARKNYSLNALGSAMAYILMHRQESTNKTRRKRATESIAETFDEGNHVLLFPQATMTLDGTVDFVNNSDNRIFDAEAYEKLKGMTKPFRVQPLHYTYDPITDANVVTFGTGHSSTESFDFLGSMRTCFTITPLQLASAYYHVLPYLGEQPSLLQQQKDITALIELTEDMGFFVYSNGPNPALLAMNYYHKAKVKLQPLITVNIANHPLAIDTESYQRNSVLHHGLETIVREFVEREK